MKDEVVSKEAFSKPQLAVQSYLDELLQEATLDMQGVDSFDSDNAILSEAEIPPIVEEDIPKQQADALQHQPVVSLQEESQEDVQISVVDPHKNAELDTEQSDANFQVNENEALTLPENLAQEDALPPNDTSISADHENTKTELKPEAFIDDNNAVSSTSVVVKAENTDIVKNEVEPKLEKTNDLPWAESRFECLLFNVGGLKIAVPLVELGSIQKANFDTITSIFGQPDWFIGISTINDLRIRAVDTAKWVMPNHYKGELKQAFNFIIQLDRSDWGLACEEVAEAITLEPSEVKWRADRSKRPWLAGTVIKHMCAILDVQGFINLLDDPDNGFKPTLK